MQKIIRSKFWNKEFLGFILIFFLLIFTYRDVFLQRKIIFPSNFLAQSYSPWSTQKFKGWENGIPHKPIGGNDIIRFFYPGRTFTTTSFREGLIPLWNPYIFAGNPHLADYQSALFYPLNILYFILPQIFAWSILVFIQPILALIFMYFYLRILSIKLPAAFLGAIAFGFSGFIIAWGQENVVVSQTALWIPLILLGIEGYIKTKKIQYFLLTLFALSSSIFAGFFQVTFYAFILAFIYGLFRIGQLKESKLWNFVVILSLFCFSLGLSAIQLIPSTEAFLMSPRPTTSSSYIFTQYLLPITHLANLLTPDIFGNPGSYNFFGRTFYNETVFYIGVIPLFFALFSFIKFRKNSLILFFTGVFITSLLLIINSPVSKWFFNLNIPLVSTFVPSRMISIGTFSLAVLSALGFSEWLKISSDKSRKYENVIFVLLMLILLSELVYALALLYPKLDLSLINNYVIRPESHIRRIDAITMLRNLLLPSFLLISSFILIKIKNKNLVGLFIALTLLSQFYFLNKYVNLGFPQFLYPDHPVFSYLEKKSPSFERFLTLGQPIPSNISTQKAIYSPEGIDPIYSNRYGQLAFATKNEGVLTNNLPRIEVNLSDLGDDESMIKNSARLRLMSLIGVRYLAYFDNPNSKISLNNRFPSDLFNLLSRFGDWYVFEYKNSLPRVFVAGNVVVEKDPQKILNLIFNQNFDLSKNIIFEEKPVGFSNVQDLQSLQRIISYKPQEIQIITNTNKQGVLFLSDNFYPGWNASIDGKPTKIYRADYSFRGVVLPRGKHKLSFKYEPESFKLGVYISVISSVLLLTYFFLIRPKISGDKD